MRQYRDYENPGVDYSNGRPGLKPADISRLTTALNTAQLGQVTPPQVTANQNNYPMPAAEVVRFTTDAARTITGFAGARPGFTILVNVGSQNLVLANASVSSSAENQIVCHTGGNITLNAAESVIVFYDFGSSRWRTIGFV